MNPIEIWNAIGSAGSIDAFKKVMRLDTDLYYVDDDSGWSFLHRAIEFEDYAFADFLLENGFDVNFVPACGYPAIFQAVDADIDGVLQNNTPLDFKSTRYLLDSGASAEIKNNQGETILGCAQSYGSIFSEELQKILTAGDD